MICPKCGKEQIKSSKFCTYCGAQMDMNGMENQSFNETNDTSGKHSSHRTASHTVHKVASTAAKAGAVGLTTKIAIGAAGVCLAAGVGAVGLHMGHNWGAGKAVVAEKESGEDRDESSTSTADGTLDESAVDSTEESTESAEALQTKETNRKAVAAYRKYLADEMKSSGKEGQLSDFCLVDLNQDGIFELFADNSNAEYLTSAAMRIAFLYYQDNVLKEDGFLPFLLYSPETSKIIPWYSKQGYIVETYQYSNNGLTELGHWDLTDNPWLMTESELLETIEDALRISGNEKMYTGNFVSITEENLDKYLSDDGMATGNGEVKYLKEDILDPIKEHWYETNKEKDEAEKKEVQKAAFIAPYKAQLDAVLNGDFIVTEEKGIEYETYSLPVKEAYESEAGLGITADSMVDMGDYCILKNAHLYWMPESSGRYGDIADFPELYIRKDGTYEWWDENGETKITLQEYIAKNGSPSARCGVKFDEQGFIVAWYDGNFG